MSELHSWLLASLDVDTMGEKRILFADDEECQPENCPATIINMAPAAKRSKPAGQQTLLGSYICKPTSPVGTKNTPVAVTPPGEAASLDGTKNTEEGATLHEGAKTEVEPIVHDVSESATPATGSARNDDPKGQCDEVLTEVPENVAVIVKGQGSSDLMAEDFNPAQLPLDEFAFYTMNKKEKNFDSKRTL